MCESNLLEWWLIYFDHVSQHWLYHLLTEQKLQSVISKRCNFCPLRNRTTCVSSINTHFSSVTLSAPLLASLRTRMGLQKDSWDKREQSHTNHTFNHLEMENGGKKIESSLKPILYATQSRQPWVMLYLKQLLSKSTTAKQIWVIIFLLK